MQFKKEKCTVLEQSRAFLPPRYVQIRCRESSLEGYNDQRVQSNYLINKVHTFYTGKSLSEALIFASTNPQYNDRFLIELRVQYMKIPSSNLGRTYCVQKLFLTFRTIFIHNMFSQCSAKRRTSDKDLPVILRLGIW